MATGSFSISQQNFPKTNPQNIKQGGMRNDVLNVKMDYQISGY